MTGESCPSGGRRWWADVEFTRINIEPTILGKKIEDFHHAQFMSVLNLTKPSDPKELR
jgi:hypothetical protein